MPTSPPVRSPTPVECGFDAFARKPKSEWLSKKRQMQGAQLSRNEAYYDYAAVTRAIAATQQLVSFCNAIGFDFQFSGACMAARILIYVFILFCLCGCLAVQQKDPGVPSSAEGKSVESEFRYRSLVDEPAGKALYHFGRAQLLAVDGEYSAALVSLEEALGNDPESAFLRLFKTELYLSMNEPGQAVRAAEDALIYDPDNPDIHQLMGNIYFELGNDAKAIFHLRRVIELGIGEQGLFLRLAVAHARSGDAESAVAVLKKLLEREPDSILGRLTLARIYRQIGLTSLAVDTFRDIIDRRPELESTYLELAGLYQQQGEVDKAIAVFREGVRNNPPNWGLRYRLIRFLVAVGRYDVALSELDKLHALQPRDSEGYRLRGLVLMEQKKWSAAEAAFQRGLELAPESDQIRFYLGTALERLELWQRAEEVFQAIPAESDLFGDATSHLGFLYHRQGRTDEAIALLTERLADLEPRAELYSYLAALYEERKQYAEARYTVDQGLKALPRSAELHYHSGLLLEREGKSVEALEAMKQAVSLNAEHAEALNFIAYAYAERGENLTEALEFARRAVALNNDGHILDTLGWVYYKMGRLNEARPELEAAAALLSEDPLVLGHLGDLYRDLGLDDRALATYRKALKLNPDDLEIRKKIEALGEEPPSGKK
jgi:tetratricopeptide (TPR) repeat protein